MMLILWSPSSVAAHFVFCFTSCVVMLAVWSPLTAAYARVKLVGCKSALHPPVVYSSDRSKAVVPVLVLLVVALWFNLRGQLF